jgi:PglZ domain
MHPFHDYLVGRLQEHLGKLVVVWYDPRREFVPFIAELRGGSSPSGCAVEKLRLGSIDIEFCAYAGSFFELRAAIEPLVAVDRPRPLLIYVPGVEPNKHSRLLMELEKAGTSYEPQLKRLARDLFRQSFTDGVIDEMLEREGLTYRDIIQYAKTDPGGGPPSVLKVVFPDAAGDNAALVAEWLASPESDASLTAKSAEDELFKLIGSRLGLTLEAGQGLADARTRTARYLLVNEWRSAMEEKAPESVSLVPRPPTKDQGQFVRSICDHLRKESPEAYERLADQVEHDLVLASVKQESASPTFRCQEQAALKKMSSLVADRHFDEALELEKKHGATFWVQRKLARKAQWEACRLMAELGRQAKWTRVAFGTVKPTPLAWVQAYTAEDGWYVVDQCQRRLEAWVSNMDEEPEAEQALGVARQDFEELLQEMATRFMGVLQQANWHIDGAMMQTHIYQEAVEPRGKRVAYFLVDALRYEMAVELRKHLEDGEELTLRPAIAAVPTITKIGMAALLPGASGSFDEVVHKEKLAAKINGTVMPDLPARQKHLKAKVPGLVDLELQRVLQLSKNQLTTKLDGATLVLVRSQEIDSLGEGGGYLARQVMDTVIGNVARGVRRLAGAGVEQFVITADHGHLFGQERGESMKTDAPEGDQVELHRRCWAGRGGQTPAGTIRVAATEFGYSNDLDFVFPKGAGVFKSGGDLAYHHGGLSLQELIVPVLCLRVRSAAMAGKPETTITVKGMPATLTNRTFGVELVTASNLFPGAGLTVRPLIVSEGQQVGEVGMAVGADFDPGSGCVNLRPGTPASIGLFLKRPECKKVRVVIQDPATDRVLGQSEEIPVKLGIS